jgi:hypothetical protein
VRRARRRHEPGEDGHRESEHEDPPRARPPHGRRIARARGEGAAIPRSRGDLCSRAEGHGHQDGRAGVGRNRDPRPGPRGANQASFEVATIAFDDGGDLADPRAVGDAAACIERARKGNPNGAIVVLFAHGWHHGPDWSDTHFASFRRVLASLALREAERYGASAAGLADRPPHDRYRLAPKGGPGAARPAWVSHVTPEVVADHNDIFNTRAASLLLALIQVSGAVMSLAQDFDDTFEP